MLKQIAWNTFKNTGDINTFMELVKVDKAMESIENGLNTEKNNGFELLNNQTKHDNINKKITL